MVLRSHTYETHLININILYISLFPHLFLNQLQNTFIMNAALCFIKILNSPRRIYYKFHKEAVESLTFQGEGDFIGFYYKLLLLNPGLIFYFLSMVSFHLSLSLSFPLSLIFTCIFNSCLLFPVILLQMCVGVAYQKWNHYQKQSDFPVTQDRMIYSQSSKQIFYARRVFCPFSFISVQVHFPLGKWTYTFISHNVIAL